MEKRKFYWCHKDEIVVVMTNRNNTLTNPNINIKMYNAKTLNKYCIVPRSFYFISRLLGRRSNCTTIINNLDFPLRLKQRLAIINSLNNNHGILTALGTLEIHFDLPFV